MYRTQLTRSHLGTHSRCWARVERRGNVDGHRTWLFFVVLLFDHIQLLGTEGRVNASACKTIPESWHPSRCPFHHHIYSDVRGGHGVDMETWSRSCSCFREALIKYTMSSTPSMLPHVAPTSQRSFVGGLACRFLSPISWTLHATQNSLFLILIFLCAHKYQQWHASTRWLY